MRDLMKKFWIFGPSIGLVVAVLFALIFSIWDLVENPGGIFRDSNGTNWNFVWDTAASWFVPTFIDTTIMASIAHIIFSGLRLIKKKYIPNNNDKLET